MYRVGGVSVTVFDVSLRDGLQALTTEQQREFSLQQKLDLYDHILASHDAEKVEIGSFVNPNVLPIFDDTAELLQCILSRTNEGKEAVAGAGVTDRDLSIAHSPRLNYVLVPNANYLKAALKVNATHFSFLASVSDSFQVTNTKMTIDANYQQLASMMALLKEREVAEGILFKVRIYVSCFNHCPLEGVISDEVIVESLVSLMAFNPETLCLSDTCGNINLETFERIIKKSVNAGLNPSRFSLHLHVQPGRELEIEKIIHLALDYKISEFDVSALATGGCSVTMDKDKLCPNLSYDLFDKALSNYCPRSCL